LITLTLQGRKEKQCACGKGVEERKRYSVQKTGVIFSLRELILRGPHAERGKRKLKNESPVGDEERDTPRLVHGRGKNEKLCRGLVTHTANARHTSVRTTSLAGLGRKNSNTQREKNRPSPCRPRNTAEIIHKKDRGLNPSKHLCGGKGRWVNVYARETRTRKSWSTQSKVSLGRKHEKKTGKRA